MKIVWLLIALFASTTALAQRKKEDQPESYSDQEEEEKRDLPSRSEPSRERREETEVEERDREISLAASDDPNIGLSGEIVAGLFLLESSRGQGVEPLAIGGLRFTWEWSRTLLRDEFWREVFFADLTWVATSLRGSGPMTGTNEVYDNTNYHYFTLTQGFAFPFGKTPLAAFVSSGIGIGFQTSTLYVQQVETNIAATRFVFQYGGGLRFRVALTHGSSASEEEHARPDGWMRLSFRLELTRFRRGYMDDTLIGGSMGLTF
jgi:hypothetical protein